MARTADTQGGAGVSGTRRDGPDAGRRERDLAHSSGLPSGARRGPRLRGRGRDDVPRRDPAHGRRVHGSRRLLRPVGLPHHLAPRGRVAPVPDHQAGGVLGPSCPPPAARVVLDAALRRLPGLGDRPQGHVRGAPARRAGHPALREQLALHSGQLELLQRDGGLLAPPAHLVACGRGAVLRDLAAGRAGHPARDAQLAGPLRALLCRRRRVSDLDVRALRRRCQHEPGLPGHRHPVPVPVHRVRPRRRARPAHAAQSRGRPLGQGGAVAARGRHRAGALRCDRRRRRRRPP